MINLTNPFYNNYYKVICLNLFIFFVNKKDYITLKSRHRNTWFKIYHMFFHMHGNQNKWPAKQIEMAVDQSQSLTSEKYNCKCILSRPDNMTK